MIELSNIIYKDKKVVRFCSSEVYQSEFHSRFRNDGFEHNKSLYIKIVRRDGDHVSWIEMPRKLFKKKQIENDYQIYFDNIVNEYGFGLNEYPKSYVDKLLKKDELNEVAKLFHARSWQSSRLLL